MKDVLICEIVTIRSRNRISIPNSMWAAMAEAGGFEHGFYLSIHNCKTKKVHVWNFPPLDRVSLPGFEKGERVFLLYSSKDKYINAVSAEHFLSVH